MDLYAIAAAPVTSGFEPSLHAADGFLSVPVSLLMWVVTLVCVGISVQRANRHVDERMVPLMGVMAAFIFAAQMFNFPVAGGTSGHLLGGVLAADPAWPLGRHAGDGLRDGRPGTRLPDGGLLAMGANIFNMGIIGTMGGFAIYLVLCRRRSAERIGPGSRRR